MVPNNDIRGHKKGTTSWFKPIGNSSLIKKKLSKNITGIPSLKLYPTREFFGRLSTGVLYIFISFRIFLVCGLKLTPPMKLYRFHILFVLFIRGVLVVLRSVRV